MAATGEVKEGFLCPICKTDQGDVIQLQFHFEEEHSKMATGILDDSGVFAQNLKDILGKAKHRIIKGIDDSLNQADSVDKPEELKVKIYGEDYPAYIHPVSGIDVHLLESYKEFNVIRAVDRMEDFRKDRARRADAIAMDTNKLILRLERLLFSLPLDAVKRKAHERSVVSWIPEEAVKLCPACAKSFNLTRRKHHCRLCGSIMCADCSHEVSIQLALRLINPPTISMYHDADDEDLRKIKSAGRSDKDIFGLPVESQQPFRSCEYCLEALKRREQRIGASDSSPRLLQRYVTLRRLMEDGLQMSKAYLEASDKLNSGQPATPLQLEDAKRLRLELLKTAESVDTISKKILEDNEENDATTLRSRIRMAAVNFVKDTLTGLPPVPSIEEHQKLQEDREREANKRIEREQRLAAEAKLKYQQQQHRLAAVVKKSSPLKQNNDETLSLVKGRGILYGTGFAPSSFSNKNASRNESMLDDEDPIVQQMTNLREFIGQARSAGRHDDAKILEDNLRDIQAEYQRQRSQWADNYHSYGHIFNKKSPSRRHHDATSTPNVSPSKFGDNDEFEDGKNPFFGSEDEMRQLAEVLGDSASNPFDNKLQEQTEQEKVLDGSADFDKYDESGKNPFFF